MGFYARRIGPHFVSCLCSTEAIANERQKDVPQASGVVLEIGIGPGLNLPRCDPAEALPLKDDSIETAVITYSPCSVEDLAQALREVRRVLFLEHGLSSDAGVAVWQHRLNLLWRRLAVGCDLTRPVKKLIDEAGFTIRSIRRRPPRRHGAARWRGFGTALAAARRAGASSARQQDP